MHLLVEALLRAYAVSLALLCLSGAAPVVEVSGWEPDDGRLVLTCPQGSCDGAPRARRA